MPWTWIIAAYSIVSLATFVAYGLDKRRALAGRRRIPERTLHRLELLGGWPGALAGQALFRHKLRKLRYMAVFAAIVALHAAACALTGALRAPRPDDGVLYKKISPPGGGLILANIGHGACPDYSDWSNSCWPAAAISSADRWTILRISSGVLADLGTESTTMVLTQTPRSLEAAAAVISSAMPPR